MSIKVLTIINPTSGKGNIINKLDEIKNNIESQNMEIEIFSTKKEYNAKKIVEENVDDKDLILICGGDGTLNETITGMMQKGVKNVSLSFIPFGTTNDLARTLGLPLKNINVIKNLLNSKAKLIDIGKFNEDKYFCYVAAFGLITDVSYMTSQKAKHRYGRMAYYINAIKELRNIPAYQMKIEYDGKKVEGEFIYGGVTNSESIAGFRWFEKGEILLDDGKFEGVFIKKPKNILGYFKILKSFFRKDYTDNNNILFIQANHIKVESQDRIRWTIDGEFAGEQNVVDIQNCEKSVEFAICNSEKI